MTSAAFLKVTMSPIMSPFSLMKSSLLSVARCTSEPATRTGERMALGVILPVRPTVNTMSNSLVDTSSGGNL